MINHLVAKYGNLASIVPMKGTDRLFPSDLWRTCARNAYDGGARLLSIQALLGFNHLETTARFIGVLELRYPNAAENLIQYNEE